MGFAALNPSYGLATGWHVSVIMAFKLARCGHLGLALLARKFIAYLRVRRMSAPEKYAWIGYLIGFFVIFLISYVFVGPVGILVGIGYAIVLFFALFFEKLMRRR